MTSSAGALPSVSVITTAYNAAPFIEATVASVLAQRGVEVEHVVVDDGSEDETLALVRAVDDPRVRVVSAGRVGRGAALNRAVEAATHDYVAVLDADDVAHPDRLALELGVMRARPDLAAVGTGQVLFSGGEFPDWSTASQPSQARDIGGELLYYNPLSHSSMLFRRTALERVGRYDERRRALFDWDLYIRLVSVGYQIAKLGTPLVAKRIHPGQFFEGRQTLKYAVACFGLQWRALGRLRRSRLNAPALLVLLGYRLVPRGVRLALRLTTHRLRSVFGR